MTKQTSTKAKIIRLSLGYGFLLFGFVGGFIPVLQGWVFIALGLILLKDHALWARRLSVWLRRKYPNVRPAFKVAFRKIDDWLEKAGLS